MRTAGFPPPPTAAPHLRESKPSVDQHPVDGTVDPEGTPPNRSAGASAIFKGGFVTYSNEAKIRQGVPAEVIGTFGVYSPQTAEAMAEACRMAYQAQIGVGVTGTTGNMDPSNADSVPVRSVLRGALGGRKKELPAGAGDPGGAADMS